MNAIDLVYKFSPETNIFPTVIDDKIIYFTNIMLTDKGSGDDIYLIKDLEGNYSLFKTGYEPDCDGSYYFGHTIEEINNLNDYTVCNHFWINKEMLWELSNLLYKINQNNEL